MKDTFSTYHPIVNFIFYIFVLGISMFFMHPIFIIISGVGALSYVFYLKGKKAILVVFAIAFPTFLLSAILNPLFSHQGMTTLFYLKSGNPITLESIVYGIVAGITIAIVVLWFSSFNQVMTSDKFIYLFGKIIPAISLILSMVFRFVPRFTEQLKKVSYSQKCIGRDVTDGNFLQKVKQGIKIISIMITWALENSVETADSMRSRGYGLRGRSHFHTYNFEKRDICVITIMAVCFIWILIGVITKQIFVLYYPLYSINQLSVYSLLSYILYFILCFLPLFLNVVEDIKWYYLKSKI